MIKECSKDQAISVARQGIQTSLVHLRLILLPSRGKMFYFVIYSTDSPSVIFSSIYIYICFYAHGNIGGNLIRESNFFWGAEPDDRIKIPCKSKRPHFRLVVDTITFPIRYVFLYFLYPQIQVTEPGSCSVIEIRFQYKKTLFRTADVGHTKRRKSQSRTQGRLLQTNLEKNQFTQPMLDQAESRHPNTASKGRQKFDLILLLQDFIKIGVQQIYNPVIGQLLGSWARTYRTHSNILKRS